jgi:hypothetical protein
MSFYETITEIRNRHREEIRLLLLAALKRNDWGLIKTATDLGKKPSSLQAMIVSHGLKDLYLKHNHGAGRPKSRANTKI